MENFIYPSIVGIDDIPFSYYNHKVTAETAVEQSDVPATIVRTTQFHSFVGQILGYVAKFPVWTLPTKMQIQPIDVGEVADIIVDHTTLEASGRIGPIGGPKVHSAGKLAQAYRDSRGLRRPIIRVPIPSNTVEAFRTGRAICPDHTTGTVTWEEWLANRYASEADETDSRVQSPI